MPGPEVTTEGACSGEPGSCPAEPDAEVEDGGAGGLEPEPAEAAAIFGDRIELARSYVRMLGTDGVIRGLIGPRETGRLWTRHLSELRGARRSGPAGSRASSTSAAAPDCPAGARDRPAGLRVALVEPLERRVRFLIEAVERLRLMNCRVVRSRAQDAPEDVRDADVVVSRAVAPLAGWRMVAGLAREGGMFLALKGSTAEEELRRNRAEVLQPACGGRRPSARRSGRHRVRRPRPSWTDRPAGVVGPPGIDRRQPGRAAAGRRNRAGRTCARSGGVRPGPTERPGRSALPSCHV